MNETEFPFPKETEDRRRRTRSRSNYRDRRSENRYVARFPVTIYVGSGKEERVYQGLAGNISDGGLQLEPMELPAENSRVRLEFRIPDGSMPEEYLHGKVRLSGELRRRGDRDQPIGVAFENKISDKLARSSWLTLRWAASAGLLVTLAFILLIRFENITFFGLMSRYSSIACWSVST